jgi:hypothetical protein
MKTNKRWDDGFMNLGGLAYYQGKDIVVFRFIIEYSSLRDFDSYEIGLFLYYDF